ncbi:MAG TPA: hypothetical protein PKN36_01500 [bacterium]|nr:hypothetical protein [bacterium]
MRIISAVLLAVFCLANVPLLYGDTFGSVNITAEPVEQTRRREHGYLEFKFHLYNQSEREACRVTLVIQGRYSSREGSIWEMRRTALVGPSSDVRLSLLQPPLSLHGDDRITVIIDGKTMGEMKVGYPLNFYVDKSAYYPRAFSSGHPAKSELSGLSRVLVSRSVDSQALEDKILKFTAEAAGQSVSDLKAYGDRFLSIIRAQSEISGWSEEWLAYTSFDGIILASEELSDMTPEIRQALTSYLECGGSLFIMGDTKWPALTNRIKGPGSIEASYSGFGQCIFSPDSSFDLLNNDELLFIKKSWNDTRSPFLRTDLGQNPNSVFPIIEKRSLPIKPIFLLLLCFAVIIGPVNILFFYKKKKHLWVFWTIPAFSLLSTGLVVIYIVLSEGIVASFRSESFTILNQPVKRASTIGISAFYSPVGMKEGLRYGYNTEVTPLGQFVSRGYIDWTSDQHLCAGWISPKVPAHFMVRKSEMRRERLEVAYENGKAVILNGLSADIGQLWLSDAQGRLHFGKEIRAGAKAVLEPMSRTMRAGSNPEVLRRLYIDEWHNPGKSIEKPASVLFINSYLAEINASPFMEKGITAKRYKEKVYSYILGIL